MKYFFRILWIIGFIPMLLLNYIISFAYTLVGFPIASVFISVFIFVKTGKLENSNIISPNALTDWFLDKYNSLLDKIETL